METRNYNKLPYEKGKTSLPHLTRHMWNRNNGDPKVMERNSFKLEKLQIYTQTKSQRRLKKLNESSVGMQIYRSEKQGP